MLIKATAWTGRAKAREAGITRGTGRVALAWAIADGLRREPMAGDLRRFIAGLGVMVSLIDTMSNEAVVSAIQDGVDRRAIIAIRIPPSGSEGSRLDDEGQRLLALMAQGASAAGEAVAAGPPVSSMGLQARFEAVLRRVPPHLPASLRAEFGKLLQPEALAIAAGVLALWGVSQFTPVGWVADLILLAGGGIMLGLAVFQIASLLLRAIERTMRAASEADLETAARDFAEVVAMIGVAAFVALIARAGTRFRGRQAPGAAPGAAAEAASPAAGQVSGRGGSRSAAEQPAGPRAEDPLPPRPKPKPGNPQASAAYRQDPGLLRGRNPVEVESELDRTLVRDGGWAKSPARDGNGIRYTDGRGGLVNLNRGYPGGLQGGVGDATHAGAYVKIQPGELRIPLAGNPALER